MKPPSYSFIVSLGIALTTLFLIALIYLICQ